MNWLNPYASKDLARRLPPYLGRGLSDRKIASILGCSHVAVWKARKQIEQAQEESA